MSTNRPSFVAADQVASLTRRATEERVVYMYVGRLVAGQFILGQFECCESSFRLTATEKLKTPQRVSNNDSDDGILSDCCNRSMLPWKEAGYGL